MTIKNYTSTVPASTSMARIEKMLVAVGASSISKRYDKQQICTGITFIIDDDLTQQSIPYFLEARVEDCYKVLCADVKRPRKDTMDKLRDQADRTAWKIMSDWTEIQCTMILLGQATPLQIFLPYVYDLRKNETLYQKVIFGKIPLMLGN